MKTCFKCQESKTLDEFYAHTGMSDGHLGKCKDCVRAYMRKRSHTDSARALTTKWQEENREYMREYNRLYEKQRCRENLSYKLSRNLRGRLNLAVKNGAKTGSAVKDLGCTIRDFISYIEGKFVEGMTWNNWGEWHLDHINPLALFDLTNDEQFLEAVHYTNYQPLWAADNLSKGKRINYA